MGKLCGYTRTPRCGLATKIPYAGVSDHRPVVHKTWLTATGLCVYVFLCLFVFF